MSSRPVAASRSLTLPSYVALAMNRPSGLKSTLSPSEVRPTIGSSDVPDPDGAIVSGTHNTVARTKAEVEHPRELTTNDGERGTSGHAEYPDHTILPAHRVAAPSGLNAASSSSRGETVSCRSEWRVREFHSIIEPSDPTARIRPPLGLKRTSVICGDPSGGPGPCPVLTSQTRTLPS